MKSLERTGRTTRMLEHAIDLIRSNKNVIIVTKGLQETTRLIKICVEKFFVTVLSSNEICLNSKVSIVFIPASKFDWRVLETDRPETPSILIDHYAIEHKFAKILEMLHRFDLNEESEGKIEMKKLLKNPSWEEIMGKERKEAFETAILDEIFE